jgi:hypothetical protein
MSAARGAGSNGLQVRTAADVRHLLVAEIESLTANPDLDPIAKARILAQLMAVALRAIERETLEARVEAIEATLKIRNEKLSKETTR